MPPVEHHEVLLTLICAMCGGVGLMIFGRKLGVPAIVLLLAGGVFLGPQALGWVQPASLGGVLPVFVSICVGIILFEGGMSLDIKGYRTAGKFIRRLVTWGVFITWVLATLALMLLADVSLPFALLAASLVTVTGPTVIMPLMKRIRVKTNLRDILSWEAVLVDPIGAFLAVLCFEGIVRQGGGAALTNFGLRIAVGLAVGLIGGLLLAWILRHNWIPEDMMSVSVLAGAVLIFGAAELVLSEAGLLSTVAGGLVLGASNVPWLKEVKRFKAELSELMIGMLFILLASRLKIDQFRQFGWDGLALVAVVVFVVRPVMIFFLARGRGFNLREKLFLSWVAPRGIVAASMASLVRITLEQRGVAKTGLFGSLSTLLGLEVQGSAVAAAEFVETFVYSVIVVTIVLQGLTAGWVVRLLGLRLPEAKGLLIVGAHRLARELAVFVRDVAGIPVFVADTNEASVKQAQREGLRTLLADARHPQPIEEFAQDQIGRVAALTNNEDLNARACRVWSEVVGSSSVCRWSTGKGHEKAEQDARGVVIWNTLGRPSRVSDELDWGHRIMRREPAAGFEQAEGEMVLAAASPGSLSLGDTIPNGDASKRSLLVVGPGPASEEETPGGAEVEEKPKL